MTTRRRALPDFPWDTLAGAKRRAGEHPGGIVDLSIGTPVDPTPDVVTAALTAAAVDPGYPQVWGTPALREAILDYLTRRWNAVHPGERGVLPVIGSKEVVAGLPHLLDLGPDDTVALPVTAYPTYAVGAAMTGSRVVRADRPAELAGERPRVVWINSPANPSGWCQDDDELRAWVEWCRAHDALLVSDECYGEFGWTASPRSVLDPEINGGSLDGVIALFSLSKRSNMAGYRAGFVAGDPEVGSALLELRKHLGMMVPGPVQAAMIAALGDHAHVVEQRQRYLARRAALKPALEASGFAIDYSDGGLYLWARRGLDGPAPDARATIDWLAERGILAAPGDFYGDASRHHVRFALTATDERIAAAAERLAG